MKTECQLQQYRCASSARAANSRATRVLTAATRVPDAAAHGQNATYGAL